MTSQTILAILTTLCVVGIVWLGKAIRKWWAKSKTITGEWAKTWNAQQQILHGISTELRNLSDSLEANTKTAMAVSADLASAAAGFSSSTSHLAAIPALVTGLTEVCKDLCSRVDQQAAVVEKLHRTLFGGQGTDGRENFTEHDETEAFVEGEVQHYMAAYGIPREEAEGRVKQERLWRGMRIER